MNWHPPVPAHVTDAAGVEWSVRRAWPGPVAGDYDMEVQEAAGSVVLAAQLRHGSIDPVPRDDPLMPALAREAAKGELLVHRAHKRAVIHAGNQYIKVFRPGRAREATVRHILAASVAGSFFATPRIISAGPDVIVFSSLPGRSYYELDQDHLAAELFPVDRPGVDPERRLNRWNRPAFDRPGPATLRRDRVARPHACRESSFRSTHE